MAPRARARPHAAPEFTHTPGQVAFTPDGSKLLVTTKANTNAIDVFDIDAYGRPSAHPVVNVEPGTVPFGVTFDAHGHLVVAEAGPNAVETFTLHHNGTLTSLDSALTGQAATCWVATDGTALLRVQRRQRLGLRLTATTRPVRCTRSGTRPRTRAPSTPP